MGRRSLLLGIGTVWIAVAMIAPLETLTALRQCAFHDRHIVAIVALQT
jgi:hypothetical protein